VLFVSLITPDLDLAEGPAPALSSPKPTTELGPLFLPRSPQATTGRLYRGGHPILETSFDQAVCTPGHLKTMMIASSSHDFHRSKCRRELTARPSSWPIPLLPLNGFTGKCFNRIEHLGDCDGKILFRLAVGRARSGSSNHLLHFSRLTSRANLCGISDLEVVRVLPPNTNPSVGPHRSSNPSPS
jgi:hypothetical protein